MKELYLCVLLEPVLDDGHDVDSEPLPGHLPQLLQPPLSLHPLHLTLPSSIFKYKAQIKRRKIVNSLSLSLSWRGQKRLVVPLAKQNVSLLMGTVRTFLSR